MLMQPPATYATTLVALLVPLAIWSTISSMELLAVRCAFAPGQPLGTDLAALTRRRLQTATLRSRVAMPGGLTTLALLRLAAGLLAPLAAGAGWAVPVVFLLLGMAGCTVLLALLTGGADGADKIALVACVAAGLIAAGQATGDRWLCLAGLAWGAGQVTIAYATSGWAKLARSFWRDGSALVAAMTSYSSGHPLAAAVVRHRGVALALAWAIILVEALFPLALIAPTPVCWALLGGMAAFHLATAVAMGLNTYPWAFVATYPCVLMANALLVG